MSEGVIELAQTEQVAQTVLAPKNGGSLRICVDYRKLNVTKRKVYPIPRMDRCI